MVIVKAGPHVNLRIRLTPQGPPRQLDASVVTDNTVYKNEVPHVDENGFDRRFSCDLVVVEPRHYGANATGPKKAIVST